MLSAGNSFASARAFDDGGLLRDAQRVVAGLGAERVVLVDRLGACIERADELPVGRFERLGDPAQTILHGPMVTAPRADVYRLGRSSVTVAQR